MVAQNRVSPAARDSNLLQTNKLAMAADGGGKQKPKIPERQALLSGNVGTADDETASAPATYRTESSSGRPSCW